MVYKKSEGSGRMRVFLVFFFFLAFYYCFLLIEPFLVVRCPCRDGWERINRRVDEGR